MSVLHCLQSLAGALTAINTVTQFSGGWNINMVTLNIEILEAYASIEDQPDDLLYLRSLSRHLKVDLCVDLLVNILSGLTPMEAFQLFERACKRSKKLVNVQAWDEALLLQLCQPDQVLFGPTEVDGTTPVADPHNDSNDAPVLGAQSD